MMLAHPLIGSFSSSDDWLGALPGLIYLKTFLNVKVPAWDSQVALENFESKSDRFKIPAFTIKIIPIFFSKITQNDTSKMNAIMNVEF